jgi:hypothetical protein
LRGNCSPMMVPKGIRPIFSPSMNSIRPTITAKMPPVTSQAVVHQLAQDQDLKQ